MQNNCKDNCENSCQQAATYAAEIQCRNSKNKDCREKYNKLIFKMCKKRNCICKTECQIASEYRCRYDMNHRKKFKSYKDCFTKSLQECNDNMSGKSLKSINSTEVEDTGENNEDENNGYSYENEEVLSKCDCPCCMKGGCNKRGYSSIWYALFVILIVLLFISMFASLVYDGKKGMKMI
jgi:hypothetical protein